MNKHMTVPAALFMASVAAGGANAAPQQKVTYEEARVRCEQQVYRPQQSSVERSAVNGLFNVGRALVGGWGADRVALNGLQGMANGALNDARMEESKARQMERCMDTKMRMGR